MSGAESERGVVPATEHNVHVTESPSPVGASGRIELDDIPFPLTFFREPLTARPGRFIAAKTAGDFIRHVERAGPTTEAATGDRTHDTKQKASAGGYVYAKCRENIRRAAHVLYVTAIGFDNDDGNVHPRDIHCALEDYAHVTYTTWKSARGAWRTRSTVFIDPVRYATPSEFLEIRPLMDRWFAALGFPLDPHAKDVCRLWFAAAVQPGQQIEVYGGGGRLLSVERMLTLARMAGANSGRKELSRPRARQTRVSGGADIVGRARAYIAQMPPAIQGSGGSTATFNVARKLVMDFELGDADAWGLLSEWNANYATPPWDEKGLRRKLVEARNARVSNPIRVRA